MPVKAIVKTNNGKEKQPAGLALFTSKAMNSLLGTWREVRDSARTAMGGKTLRPDLPENDMPFLRQQINACLEPKGGEVTARANTVELGALYLGLNEQGRVRFFALLAADYGLDDKGVNQAAKALADATESRARHKAEQALRDALTSPRTKLLRQFNALPDGFKFLVDMRGELLDHLKDHPELSGLEQDLKDVLTAWFDIGLLDMAEISWKSPAALLEKLMMYEAVHAIKSWDDLKNRLDADRRVFGFFHNKMPLEPLIFVQVAFTKGLADNVQELLDESKPVMPLNETDTAIFYSISNAQKGLAGISFGNFLIKRVAATLGSELPMIKTYATLSPVPAFRAWLDPLLADAKTELLSIEEQRVILKLAPDAAKDNANKAMLAILNQKGWHEDAARAETLKPILLRLVAHYLVEEKKGKRALDPVAHFHLSNGARLRQVNWLGDTSPKGFKQSAGLMVNYHYELNKIDDNHEAYVTDGKVSVSKDVLALVK